MQLMELAERLGKTDLELDADLEEFKTRILKDYLGTLTDEELEKKAKMQLEYKYRQQYISFKNSPAVPVKVFVTGVTKLRDAVSYKRNQCIETYDKNPNKAIALGMINEYTVVGDTIIKRFYNTATKAVEQEDTGEMTANAEHYKDNIYIAPRDNKRKFGARDNPNYGNELPLHSYQRDVHGIAQIGNEARKCTVLLRGKNTTLNYIPTPGYAYNVRVLNQTKAGSTEFSLMDSPTYTKWIPTDWEPYGNIPFIEGVLKEDFMEPYLRTLGELKGIATEEFEEKAANREREITGDQKTWNKTKFNFCYFVEAELVKLVLYPEGEGKVSRVTLDDDSVEFDLDSEYVESITGWLSEPALTGLNTGEGSRAILCCYPRIVKSKDANRPNSLTVDVFGILPIEAHRTKFDRSSYEKVNLDEYEE